jgi:hypothetical protein
MRFSALASMFACLFILCSGLATAAALAGDGGTKVRPELVFGGAEGGQKKNCKNGGGCNGGAGSCSPNSACQGQADGVICGYSNPPTGSWSCSALEDNGKGCNLLNKQTKTVQPCKCNFNACNTGVGGTLSCDVFFDCAMDT